MHTIKTIIHRNSVVSKSKNKRCSIFLPDKDTNGHLIEFTSLVSETTNKPSAITEISENGKIKLTGICLSNEGLFNLKNTLDKYFDYLLSSHNIIQCPNCNTFQEKSNKECINNSCNTINK